MDVKFSRLLPHIEANIVMCRKCYQTLSSGRPYSWESRLKSIHNIVENDARWFSLVTHYVLFQHFWTFVWSTDKKVYKKLGQHALVFIYIWIHGHLHYNNVFILHWKGLLTIYVTYKAARTFMVMCKQHFENFRAGVPLWVSVTGCLMPRFSINLRCKWKKGKNSPNKRQ